MRKTSQPTPQPITDQGRRDKGMALLTAGFRPFFLLAGLFGALSVPVWLALYGGNLEWLRVVEPRLWHGHEMLFGYTVAAMAGFLLTVIPNWTGQQVARQPALAFLAILWVVGRVAYWGQALMSPLAVAVLDLAFLATLMAMIAPVLVKPQYRRQLVFLAIIGLLLAGNALTHAQMLGFGDGDLGERGLRLGLDTMVLLITVLGGRVIPSFTSSFLGHGNPEIKVRSTPWVERSVIGLTVLALIAGQAMPDSPLWTYMMFVLAGLNVIRLSGWQTRHTLGNPLVWVLHLGYGWLIIGIALQGAGQMDWGIKPITALHALTIGAIGTMTLAIMSRAALGHTGRALRAHPLTVAAYGGVSVAAVIRLSVEAWPQHHQLLLAASGTAWTVAYICFCIIYVPILVSPRRPR